MQSKQGSKRGFIQTCHPISAAAALLFLTLSSPAKFVAFQVPFSPNTPLHRTYKTNYFVLLGNLHRSGVYLALFHHLWNELQYL
jgi:hypothetical protein